MMESWDQPTCSYMHKPLQLLWYSSEEWYLLVMLYAAGLMTDAIVWILIVPAAFSFIPAIRKKSRSYFKHTFLLFGLRNLHGYPPATSGKFHE